eukprot:1418155-Prymnesium_polylepis.1
MNTNGLPPAKVALEALLREGGAAGGGDVLGDALDDVARYGEGAPSLRAAAEGARGRAASEWGRGRVMQPEPLGPHDAQDVLSELERPRVLAPRPARGRSSM